MNYWQRHSSCLNCNTTYEGETNFCPNCGQRNTSSKISSREVFSELIDSLFNINSRVARSILPFLIRPGQLTSYFLSGKRMHYVHPIRFYLFMSLFFFFTFKIANDSFDNIKLKSERQRDLMEVKRDSIISNMNVLLERYDDRAKIRVDSALLHDLRDEIVSYKKQDEEFDDDNQLNIDIMGDSMVLDLNKLSQWAKIPSMTPETLLDSLGVQDKGMLNQLIAMKLLKYGKTEGVDDIIKEVIDNIPIMMIVLLPLFAFLLKALYFRRKHYYIEHLIFSIHLHTFFYFLGGISMIFEASFDVETEAIRLLVGCVYTFFSFRRVYQQHWWKTIIKILLLFFAYGFLLGIAGIFEILISLLIF